jgi:hypothetical protein
MQGGGSKNASNHVDDQKLNFTAYPVPFDQEVNIKYNLKYDSNIVLEVFDGRGILIRKIVNTNYSKNTDGITKINLSGLQNQFFYVKLTTIEGSVIKKIVSSSSK